MINMDLIKLWLWRLNIRLKYAYICRIFYGIQSYATIKMWLSNRKIEGKNILIKIKTASLSNIATVNISHHIIPNVVFFTVSCFNPCFNSSCMRVCLNMHCKLFCKRRKKKKSTNYLTNLFVYVNSRKLNGLSIPFSLSN